MYDGRLGIGGVGQDQSSDCLRCIGVCTERDFAEKGWDMSNDIWMCRSRFVEVNFGLLARLDDEFAGRVGEDTITIRLLVSSEHKNLACVTSLTGQRQRCQTQ